MSQLKTQGARSYHDLANRQVNPVLESRWAGNSEESVASAHSDQKGVIHSGWRESPSGTMVDISGSDQLIEIEILIPQIHTNTKKKEIRTLINSNKTGNKNPNKNKEFLNKRELSKRKL